MNVFAPHLALSVVVVFVAGQSHELAAQEPTLAAIKTTPDVVVYRGVYPGWPWVARTPGGKLVCVWREGTQHGFSDVGKLMISQSDDAGKSWSAARTFHDELNIDDRNVAICVLTDSDWLVCYNTETGQASRVMTLRTKDGGRTWSRPQLVCDLHARTRSAPIKLSSGELLLPFYRAPGAQSLVALSQDDGKSWEIVEIANHPGFVGDEWDAVELADKRLVGIIRNSTSAPGSDGTFYKTDSRDRGRTWSKPVRTNLRDSRSHSPPQIFLHNGRPIVLYADAREISVAMAISDDPNLVKWNVDSRLPCYQYRTDGRAIADGGYPASTAVGGNRRFVVDYQHDGADHLITGYFVELPEAWGRRRGN